MRPAGCFSSLQSTTWPSHCHHVVFGWLALPSRVVLDSSQSEVIGRKQSWQCDRLKDGQATPISGQLADRCYSSSHLNNRCWFSTGLQPYLVEDSEDKNASKCWSVSERQRLVCNFVTISPPSNGVGQSGKTGKEWGKVFNPPRNKKVVKCSLFGDPSMWMRSLGLQDDAWVFGKGGISDSHIQ